MMTQEKAYELNFLIGQHYYKKLGEDHSVAARAIRWVFRQVARVCR
jgi:hypothetical protein